MVAAVYVGNGSNREILWCSARGRNALNNGHAESPVENGETRPGVDTQLTLISTENHLAANNSEIDFRFFQFFCRYLEDIAVNHDEEEFATDRPISAFG